MDLISGRRLIRRFTLVLMFFFLTIFIICGRYFINVSNALFLKSEAEGLATRDGRDYFLMACWLAMAAAEVDGFNYGICNFEGETISLVILMVKR